MQGIDKRTIVRRSTSLTSKWVFTITYADFIDGVKVWRKYPNYISEYFKTKRDANAELSNTLLKH